MLFRSLVSGSSICGHGKAYALSCNACPSVLESLAHAHAVGTKSICRRSFDEAETATGGARAKVPKWPSTRIRLGVLSSPLRIYKHTTDTSCDNTLQLPALLTSTPLGHRLTDTVGSAPDGPLAHLEVLAERKARCERLRGRRAQAKAPQNAPNAVLAAATNRSCTSTAAAALPGLGLACVQALLVLFLRSRSSRRPFLAATFWAPSLAASASISQCFFNRTQGDSTKSRSSTATPW